MLSKAVFMLSKAVIQFVARKNVLSGSCPIHSKRTNYVAIWTKGASTQFPWKSTPWETFPLLSRCNSNLRHRKYVRFLLLFHLSSNALRFQLNPVRVRRWKRNNCRQYNSARNIYYIKRRVKQWLPVQCHSRARRRYKQSRLQCVYFSWRIMPTFLRTKS